MLFYKLCDPRFSLITDLFIVLEIEKKNSGCPHFKSRAAKPVNLVMSHYQFPVSLRMSRNGKMQWDHIAGPL